MEKLLLTDLSSEKLPELSLELSPKLALELMPELEPELASELSSRAVSHQKKTAISLLLFTLVSMLLHLLLVWAMQRHVVITATTSPTTTIPALPIETYLLFSPATSAQTFSDKPNETDMRDAEIQTSTQAQANQIESQLDAQSSPDSPAASLTNPDTKVQSQPDLAEQLNPAEPEASQPAIPVQTDMANVPALNTPAKSTPGNIEQLTQRFFSQTQERALDVIAREAAQEAFQQKTSPTLPKLSTLTEQERLLKTQPGIIEVTCKNELQRQLTTLSGLMGGRVSCGVTRDIQPFLDARLKKLTAPKTATKK